MGLVSLLSLTLSMVAGMVHYYVVTDMSSGVQYGTLVSQHTCDVYLARLEGCPTFPNYSILHINNGSVVAVFEPLALPSIISRCRSNLHPFYLQRCEDRFFFQDLSKSVAVESQTEVRFQYSADVQNRVDAVIDSCDTARVIVDSDIPTLPSAPVWVRTKFGNSICSAVEY